MDVSAVGKRIKELRQERDLTQAQLGAMLDMSVQRVSDLERGRRSPVDAVLKAAKFFGVDPARLVSGPDPRERRSAPERLNDSTAVAGLAAHLFASSYVWATHRDNYPSFPGLGRALWCYSQDQSLWEGKAPDLATRLVRAIQGYDVDRESVALQSREGLQSIAEALGQMGVPDPVGFVEAILASVDVALPWPRNSPFVRPRELEDMKSQWRQVLDGNGAVLVLQGKLGSGKTTVVQAFRQHIVSTMDRHDRGARNSFHVLWCHELKARQEFHPITDFLHRVIRDDPGRWRLFRSSIQALETEERLALESLAAVAIPAVLRDRPDLSPYPQSPRRLSSPSGTL